MFWQEAEPTDFLPIRRFVSTPTARWELGIRPAQKDPLLQPEGIVSVALLDGDTQLEYNCGTNDAEWFLYLGVIAGLCMFLPEEIDPNELRRIFPQQSIYPLRDDKKCVEALFGLTDILKRYAH